MSQQVNQMPRPVDEICPRPLPEGLSALINSCLEKHPINRPQTAHEANGVGKGDEYPDRQLTLKRSSQVPKTNGFAEWLISAVAVRSGMHATSPLRTPRPCVPFCNPSPCRAHPL